MAGDTASLQEHHWRAMNRFGLMVGLFVGVSAANAASGLSNPFFALTSLSTLLCVGLALAKREALFGQSLSYWDEASWFMLIACLGSG